MAQRPARYRILPWSLFGAAAIVLAATLAWREVWSDAPNGRKSNTAPYLTAPVTKGPIERTVLAAGVIQPVQFVDVGAQISGQLRMLSVRLGDRVQAGQLLGEIDPVLNQAKLVEAEATLENLRAQRRAKQDQLALADQQRKRSQALVALDALAKSEAEVMDSNFRVALSSINSLDAQMKQAQAGIATARAQLGYTRIVAPMDGEVVTIMARQGQTLNANQTAPNILRIARLDTMTVWSQVAEADITSVKVGQEAYFTILGDQQTRRSGKVRQILPGPEIVNGVVFYNALFDVPNPDADLKVQMTAQVFFVQDQAGEALLVPLAALRPDKQGRADRHRVKVVLADGTAETRSVKTGIKGSSMVQVLAGLSEGEQVVIGDEPAGASRAAKPAKPRVAKVN